MAKLRAGIAGGGFISSAHEAALALLRGFAVPYAIADNDPPKRRILRKSGAFTRVYSSVEDMLADPRVDTIHIAGPDELHAPWIKEAIKRKKKAIICEKPMTRTLVEAVELADTVQKFEHDGGVFGVSFNYMGHAMPRALRELSQRGYFGKEVLLTRAFYLQAWLAVNQILSPADKISLQIPDVWNWRLDAPDKMCAAADIVPHMVNAPYFVAGLFPTGIIVNSSIMYPERVKEKDARADAFAGGAKKLTKPRELELVTMESDLYTAALVRYQNGAVGDFMATQVLPGNDNNWGFTIGGTQRSAMWNQNHANTAEIGQTHALTRNPRDASGTVYPPGEVGNITLRNNPADLAAMGCYDAASCSPHPGEHYPGHIRAFANNTRKVCEVATGKVPRDRAVFPGFTCGFMSVAVADAIRRSKASRNWERVDYKGYEAELKEGKL